MSATEIDVVSQARELTAALSASAAANEAKGALTDATVRLLLDSGVGHMWVPRYVGGVEATPLQGLATIEALAYADAASGWVVMAWPARHRDRGGVPAGRRRR